MSAIALTTTFANLPLNDSDLTQHAQTTMAINLAVGKGITSGLVISAGSGLTLNVSAGAFTAQVPSIAFTAFTLTLPPSFSGFVWIQNPNTGNTPNALFQTGDPGSTYVNLGFVTTSATAITSVDPSQAQMYGSASLATNLGTTAPKSVGGNLSVVGVHKATQGFGLATVTMTSGAATLTDPSELIVATGTPSAASTLTVLAIQRKWIVYNLTGQTLTVQASSGTGVSIAAGKTATVFYYGGNVVRATPDA